MQWQCLGGAQTKHIRHGNREARPKENGEQLAPPSRVDLLSMPDLSPLFSSFSLECKHDQGHA